MSVFGLERSATRTVNAYDHAIGLVDTTKPRESLKNPLGDDLPSSPISRSDSGAPLSKQSTRGALRKQLAQRKYAKYQEGKAASGDPVIESSEESSNDRYTGTLRASNLKQDSERTGRLRDKIPFRPKKSKAKSNDSADTFIDVLYENQRGSFLFGIPMYSSNSLLNLDPSPWQTANFQDSAVNITNFQLPDPSWTWDWKTWYVDMSHDVDEEGWEYSFSFNNVYSWHGTHPWLFSFVRRRRWLRKRVMMQAHNSRGEKDGKSNAHMLNADYFTIHAANRERSRGSSAERSTTNRSSYIYGLKSDHEDEQDLGEISNILALMTALKRARVDREKIAAVKTFLKQGGDELFYLADYVPELLSLFVHQTSRRQFQSSLLEILDETTKTRDVNFRGMEQSTEESDVDIEARARKIDNLLKAVNAAGVHVNDVNYWSDLRTRATSSKTGPTDETHALDATESAEVAKDSAHSHSDGNESSVRDEIKGIPEDAHISKEPRIRFDTRSNDSDDNKMTFLDKGKGKE